MIIRVLGGHGGKAKGFETTSFLVDTSLLVDAGAVAASLSIDEQKNIDHILITHTHLDHIKDLAFISDNCFGLRKKPFEVHTHLSVQKCIKDHLLNDIIWPDFSKLPSEKNPTIHFNQLLPEGEYQLGKYKIIPVSVNHPTDAMGYIVDDGECAVIFTGDTGPTQRIWELAQKQKNLKAIFTEVSFPNHLQKVADLSHHHTTDTIKNELQKMPPNVQIILTHLKPNYSQEVRAEIALINDPRIKVLSFDGQEFRF